MKKLKLDLDSVTVESFETTAGRDRGATILGYQDMLNPFGEVPEEPGGGSDATCLNSCPTNWCGTCANTCWNTCPASCPGTTGATE